MAHHVHRPAPMGERVLINESWYYIDFAVKRWQDFTGKAATLEGDGRTFGKISGKLTEPEAQAA